VQVKERGSEGNADFGYQSILSSRRGSVSTECNVQQACQQTGGRSVLLTPSISLEKYRCENSHLPQN